MGKRQSEERMALDGELTIFRAEELKAQLLASVGEGKTLALDLSAVSEIDTAGVQLLLALGKGLAGRGGRLQLVAVSEPVREALRLFGIEEKFAA